MAISTNYCVVVLITALCIHVGVAEKFLNKPVAFCGVKLSQALSQYCMAYYAPPGHRMKRQIIQECCYNKCSLKYLLENYCESVNTEAYEEAASERTEKELSIEDVVSAILNKRERRKFNNYNEIHAEDRKNNNNRNLKTHKKKRRKRNNCTCKRKKRLLENIQKLKSSVPESRIGVIQENAEKPFYVQIS